MLIIKKAIINYNWLNLILLLDYIIRKIFNINIKIIILFKKLIKN